jgi:hypothetical protein
MDGLMAGDRGGNDDVTALTLDHLRQNRANPAEDAVDVDSQQLVPSIGITVGDVARNVESGIGQQNVDAAETANRRRHDACDFAGFGQVGGDR